MESSLSKFGWALLTIFIVLNYGLVMRASMQKIRARVSRRVGVRFYQFYIDLIKAYSIRTHLNHGVMYYLGPVFRLTGGLGMLMFIPVIYGSMYFQNYSSSGDLILVLYFFFFGTLGMALGAGEGGNPNAAIGVSRGLSQMSVSELPLIISVVSVAAQFQTLSITEIVAAQQGGFMNWVLFSNPLAFATGFLALLASFAVGPFGIIIAPQEIPIGPPTEYGGSSMGVLMTNRSIFPVAKLILYTNLFLGGATSWIELFVKTFLFFFLFSFVGMVFPRFRTEQSVDWFLKVPLVLGVITLIVTSILY